MNKKINNALNSYLVRTHVHCENMLRLGKFSASTCRNIWSIILWIRTQWNQVDKYSKSCLKGHIYIANHCL